MSRGRTNVESRGLTHLEATQQLYVSGNLYVSGTTNIIALSFSDGSSQSTAGSGAGAVTGSDYFFVTNGLDVQGFISSSVGHLILSASGGSVIAMSGALKPHQLTTATLPVGLDTLSGSVLWLTDVKHHATYGPEGWTRILTGAL